MKDINQITLGPEHHAHHMRNLSNPFYTGSATPELDAAIGIQGIASKAEVHRDACGVVRKAEEAPAPLPGMKF